MKHLILFGILIAIGLYSFANPPAVEEGKAIFTSRCGSCHNINKIVVGPALAGVDQRHTIDWIIQFVHSPQTMIKSGDKSAVALYTKFNNFTMPDHPDLTADNIKSVVEYIKSEGNASTDAEKAPFARPSILHPAYMPLSLSNYGFIISYLCVIILLIFALLLLVRVKEYQRNKV